MVSAGDLRELALVPVRGTVYLASLPFVLTWKLVGLLYALFIRTPVNYAKNLATRLLVTWNWTKSSVKSLFSWTYYSSSSSVGIQAGYAIEARQSRDHYLSEAEALLVQRRPTTRSGRRRRRRAIISSLIRALLEPTSPPDSDEEMEGLSEEDRMYQLVRELISISRQDTGSSESGAANLPVLNLEALKYHARDRQKLLAFITELDELVANMDSEAPNRGCRTRRTCASAANGSGDSGSQQGVEVAQELLVPTDPASPFSPDSYKSIDLDKLSKDDSEGESDLGESYDESQLNMPYSDLAVPQHRGLSPLVEVSSDVASVESIESVRNCDDLETELNAALSRLSSITSDLEVEEAVVEARQTKVTETVTIVPDQEEGRTLQADNTKSNEKADVGKDANDEFPSIPKTEPTLGLEAGHSKRNLASARKPRPPTLLKGVERRAVKVTKRDGYQSGDSHGSEYSSDEEEGSECLRMQGLSHSLSDQVRLLAPSSLQTSGAACSAALEREGGLEKPSTTSSDLYSTVNKESRRPGRAQSLGSDSQEFESGSIHKTKSSSLSELKGDRADDNESSQKAPEASLFIHDRLPPWKQMRSRSNSNAGSTTSSASTPTQAPAHPFPALHAPAPSEEAMPPPIPPRTPPPIPPRTHASHFQPIQLQSQTDFTHESEYTEVSREDQGVYDRLAKTQMMPPIPFHAGQEGVYDSIPGQQQARTHYLHEKLERRSELQQSRPPVTWTPDLPPRNLRMRRTTSAEGVSEVLVDSDHPRLKRSGSERRRSTPTVEDLRSERPRSSSVRRRSSSSERELERMSRREQQLSSSDQHRHHHHGEHSGSGGRQRSSSEKHRSSSSSSSKPKEIGMGTFLKLLVSPSPSKSGTKESPKKKEGDKVKKEEQKSGKDVAKKHKPSSKIGSEDADRPSERIPRNGSKTSL